MKHRYVQDFHWETFGRHYFGVKVSILHDAFDTKAAKAWVGVPDFVVWDLLLVSGHHQPRHCPLSPASALRFLLLLFLPRRRPRPPEA